MTKQAQNETEITPLEYIDWKESYYYRQLILRHVDDNIKLESLDLIHEDEEDFLSRNCRSYMEKKVGFKPEQLLKIAPAMIKKCYNTIEMIYKEILTESYWRVEYD